MILYGKKLNLDEDLINYNKIRGVFEERKEIAVLDWKKKYDTYKSIDVFMKKWSNDAGYIIDREIQIAVDILISKGIYEINKELFFEKYFSSFFTLEEDFQDIEEAYYSIVLDQQSMDEYRTRRRQGRGKMVGGGFGLVGAAKGSMMAGSVNLASNAIHGTFNLVGKGIDSVINSLEKTELYESQNTKNKLKSSIATNVFKIHYSLVSILLEKTSENIKIIKDDEIKKVKALIATLKTNEFPGDKEEEIVNEILNTYPYNQEIYEYLFDRYGDDGSLSKLIDFFHLDSYRHRKYKEKYLKQYLGTFDLSYRNDLEELSYIKKINKGALETEDDFREKGYYYKPIKYELLEYTRLILIRKLLLEYSKEIHIDDNTEIISEYDKYIKDFKNKMLLINNYKASDLEEATYLKGKREELEEKIKLAESIIDMEEKEKEYNNIIDSLRKEENWKFYLEYRGALNIAKNELNNLRIEEYITDASPKTIEEYKQCIKYIIDNFEKEIVGDHIKKLENKILILEGKEKLMESLDKGKKAISNFLNSFKK